MDSTNWQMDWAALDAEYQEYCDRCRKEGKRPDDFGTWFMVDVTKEKSVPNQDPQKH